jgi:hypothetical protein
MGPILLLLYNTLLSHLLMLEGRLLLTLTSTSA